MTYTEIKEKHGNKYYYRAKSVRKGKKISKKRIYLGVNLSKKELNEKEIFVDKEFEVNNKNNEALKKIKSKIIEILKKNKIKKAGIFGSYARGDQKKDSDIDILIEPTKDMGFKFAGLEIKLSEKLNKKVDLVSYNSLNPFLKKKILNQEIKII